MNNGSFVFACANPEGEFNVKRIQRFQKKGKLKNIAVLGCGRYGISGVTTLNNCYVFPGFYRALVDFFERKWLGDSFSQKQILSFSEAAANALAQTISRKDLQRRLVLPPTFVNGEYNFEVTQKIAAAVHQDLIKHMTDSKLKELALGIHQE